MGNTILLRQKNLIRGLTRPLFCSDLIENLTQHLDNCRYLLEKTILMFI